MRLVIDASVAVKWFNQEELSDKAVEVKDLYVGGAFELAAPVHLIYEVGNSIWKNPQLTEEDASGAIASLLRMNLELLTPSVDGASRAMEIARLRKITFPDASYLQAAEQLETALLTADESQVTAGEGIAKTIHLREARL